MPILYKMKCITAPHTSASGKYYALTQHTGTWRTREVARLIQANCSLKESDVLGVFSKLVCTMKLLLQDSQRVQLDGFGTFKNSLQQELHSSQSKNTTNYASTLQIKQRQKKNSRTAGLYFARAVHVGVIDADGLAKIMQANCTIKATDIKAVLTELGETIATQLQNSIRVKLDGLGSFKIGIRGIGSKTIDEYSVAKNVRDLHTNFQPETKKDATGLRQRAMLGGMKVRNENIEEKEATKAKSAPSTTGGINSKVLTFIFLKQPITVQ
ncbi:hypothetical protein [Xylanibacter oryzae]|uniref:HU family DNA-binding protein n=1 Tax=Xylanibacter oryzae TaxID=185293 RepID=UPI0004B98279|nr:hypothetical protein [Xylanibacter oryzae]